MAANPDLVAAFRRVALHRQESELIAKDLGIKGWASMADPIAEQCILLFAGFSDEMKDAILRPFALPEGRFRDALLRARGRRPPSGPARRRRHKRR
jgi:hypothetical protein